jgi:hypothetical protein
MEQALPGGRRFEKREERLAEQRASHNSVIKKAWMNFRFLGCRIWKNMFMDHLRIHSPVDILAITLYSAPKHELQINPSHTYSRHMPLYCFKTLILQVQTSPETMGMTLNLEIAEFL